MSKYVPDVSTKRWVLIADQRIKRPHIIDKKDICHFCPGNENLSKEEVYRLGNNKISKTNWKVRVVKNKYPITDIHEIIILTPHHNINFEDLPHKDQELIFLAFVQRYNQHRQQGQVMIFGNHQKLAGASIDHPHAQLVVIPNQINLDALIKQPIKNAVYETKKLIAYCPDFSQWPYEVWIVPKEENTYYGDIDDNIVTDLAIMTKIVINKLEHIFKHSDVTKEIIEDKELFAYNYYIYPKCNWYFRIIPRFINRAGFELGTGLSVNIIDPINAAEELIKTPPHSHKI